MRYFYYCLFLVVVGFFTTFSYFKIEKGWVAFQRGENDFVKRQFQSASLQYFIALENGVRNRELFEHLAESVRVVQNYRPSFELLQTLEQKHALDYKLKEGIALFYKGIMKYEDAVSKYQEILKIKPADFAIRLALARLFIAGQNYDMAILEYRKILLMQDKIDVDILLEYARNLYLAKRFDEAESVYHQLLELHPSYELSIELANLFFAVKKYKEALEVLKKVPLSAMDSHSRMVLGDLETDRGDFKAALKAYRIAKKNGSGMEAQLRIAQLYARSGNYSAAIAEYEKILKTRPEDGQVARKLAFLFLWNKELQKAITTMKSALLLSSDQSVVDKDSFVSDFDARLFIARILASLPDGSNEAITEYRSMIGDYKLSCLHQELGELYLKLERYDEAEREFDEIIKVEPKDHKALFCKGRAYLKNKKFAKAIDVFRNLNRLYPSDDETVKELADAYAFSGKYEEAIEIYRHLIARTNGKDVQLMLTLGNLLLLEGELKKALKWFTRAYGIDSESIELKKRYALALSWSGKYKKALPLLEQMDKKYPQDAEIGLELARVYFHLEKFREAQKRLEQLESIYPDSLRIKMEIANFEIYKGNFYDAKHKYEEILKQEGMIADRDLLLSYAAALSSWGDFYKAEKICRENLIDPRFELRLAKILGDTDRYEEAKGFYLDLIEKNLFKAEAALKLVRLYEKKKDYGTALFYAKHFLKGKNERNLYEIAKLEYLKGNYKESFTLFSNLSPSPEKDIWMARAHYELGDRAAAIAFLEKSQATAKEFYLKLWKNQPLEFIEKTAKDYLEIASLCLENGLYKTALKYYKKALKIKPNLFEAEVGIMETLAIQGDYEASLARADLLLKKFAGNTKILLWKARTLGWAKKYDESLKIYEKLAVQDNFDPVVAREMARVAIWDKNLKLAKRYYSRILTPSVDELSKSYLLDPKRQYEDRLDIPYDLYERVKAKGEISPAGVKNIQPFYEIQKSIYLEKKYKELFFNNRFSQAQKQLKELLALNPENQEARFDLAQTYCIFGLKREAFNEYKSLLKFSPGNNLAKNAYLKSKILSHPYLQPLYSYYRENGMGDIDRVATSKIRFTLGIPIAYNHELALASREWWNTPYFQDGTMVLNKNALSKPYFSQGYAVSYEGVFSSYAKIFAEFSQKFYMTGDFSDKNFGIFGLGLNIFDYFHLTLRYDREEKIDNYYSLLNSIMYSRVSCEVQSDLCRRIFLDAYGRYYIFSDHNTQNDEWLKLRFSLTDHQMSLRLGLIGEHENTKHGNIYIYNGPYLENIIHPYWTPMKYFSGRVQLEWLHDLSSRFYCGNNLVYYDLKFNTGTDTEDNPMFSIEGEFNVEYKDHFTFLLKAFVHRSSLWNSDGVNLMLKYQF